MQYHTDIIDVNRGGSCFRYIALIIIMFYYMRTYPDTSTNVSTVQSASREKGPKEDSEHHSGGPGNFPDTGVGQ